MSLNPETWTIVALGFWNRMIFTPQWVSDEIFNSNEIERLIPFDPVAPLIYRDNDLALQIEDRRIQLSLRKIVDDAQKKAEGMACKILDLLQKTPVSAVGVNFQFTENSPEKDLLDLFNFKDDVEVDSSSPWEIESKTIYRKFLQEEKNLNLRLIYNVSSSDVKFNFNYHHPVKTAIEGSERIKNNTAELYKNAIKFLEEIYNLHLEEVTNEG